MLNIIELRNAGLYLNELHIANMKVHIGKLIGKVLKEHGIQKSEFARRINKTRQNIDDIFKRESIDTELLYNISLVLKHDFFQHYSSELKMGDLDKVRNENYIQILKELKKINKKLVSQS
jgi:hypothetical protein